MLLFFGCFPDEKSVPALPPFVQGIDLDRDARGEIYYSLRDRKVVKWNSIYDWDLAFSCNQGAFDIKLNPGKRMGVYHTNSVAFDFDYQADLSKYEWTYDHPNGNPELTAIGDWGDFNFENPQSYGEVYLVHRGFDFFNLPFKPKKIKIEGYNTDAYQIVVSDFDGKEFERIVIPKNDSFNYVYLNFDKPKKILHLEPSKDDWDLLFTTYIDSTRFYNQYSKSDTVNMKLGLYEGILLNPYQHALALNPQKTFGEIGFFDVGNFNYEVGRNLIGANWYQWNTSQLKYELSEQRTFVVKKGGFYYYVIDFVEVEKPNRQEFGFRFALKNL